MTNHRIPAAAAFVIALALSGAAAPLLAARPLQPEERLGLRCGAAFAMVAAGQARGDAAMKAYPPMAQRGREFFVRLSAQLMDDAGMDQPAIAAAARSEADALRRAGGPAPVMPVCLRVLQAQPPLRP
jgi:hypothetical protein